MLPRLDGRVIALPFLLILSACSSSREASVLVRVPCQVPFQEKESEKLPFPILNQKGGQGPVEIAQSNKQDVEDKEKVALKFNANLDFVRANCILDPNASVAKREPE